MVSLRNLMTLALLYTITDSPLQVQAHGHVTSPRSRNWRAHQENLEYNQNGLNKKLNGSNTYGSGICGVAQFPGVETHNYDNFLTSWNSEATYNAGQEITIATTLTAYHGGHFEVGACSDPNPTQACFDRNKLDYVGGGFGQDPSYPKRAYVGEPAFRVENRNYSHRFRLPAGLSGDRVLLQWRYYTGNSCKYPGYDEYFARQGWQRSNLGMCNNSILDDDGTSIPERFWNCMEVTIRGGGSGPSPSPPSGGTGTCGRGNRGNGRCANESLCCSQYGWCGSTSAHCAGGGGRPSPPVRAGYCNWNNCDGNVNGGWCDVSSSNCARCSGRWCTR